jgi:hypothetical protein
MPMYCAELAEVAPELALEILGGRERAAAIAHLAGCASCQQLVDTLATEADRLLLLAPTVEPPPGFQQRVLESLTQAARPPAPRSRPRPRVLTALALAACIAIAAVVLSIGGSARPALATADMRTDDGEVVGQVLVQREPSAALFMTMPGWGEQVERYAQPHETYSLRIERVGQPPRLLPLDLEDDESWATTLDIDPDAVTTVAVVDSRGHVWCEADV